MGAGKRSMMYLLGGRRSGRMQLGPPDDRAGVRVGEAPHSNLLRSRNRLWTMPAMGHEDLFPPQRLNARCRFRKRSSDGIRDAIAG